MRRHFFSASIHCIDIRERNREQEGGGKKVLTRRKVVARGWPEANEARSPTVGMSCSVRRSRLQSSAAGGQAVRGGPRSERGRRSAEYGSARSGSGWRSPAGLGNHGRGRSGGSVWVKARAELGALNGRRVEGARRRGLREGHGEQAEKGFRGPLRICRKEAVSAARHRLRAARRSSPILVEIWRCSTVLRRWRRGVQ
ncbi:formin-like protein 5 [Iris pallida]|uniref:Formin-like protein 5 n=1 Tax=Iris pallida TaxID=29817 RepID=A0AAX6E6N0_IRIPA|nr:formin-like protein 5 [Iris pallida]KAJ6800287.1 formin-like protein 5 [Iris pallida]